MIDIDGFERYLYDEELSKNTRESYMFSIKKFAENFDTVTKANIISWKEVLLTDKSPKTVNLRLSAIGKYCKYKKLNIDFKRVKVQKILSVEDVITVDEYERLLNGLIGENKIRFAIIVLLMAKTGARISEIVRLKKRDLKKDHIDMKTKGKFRRIYFPDTLKDRIESLAADIKDDEYLCQTRSGTPITRNSVYEFLQSCSKKYGIPKSHLHPHAFRHMFAIEFLKRNNNISLLADILGHSGVNTTMIYLRMSQQEQKKEIDKAVNW